MALFLSTWDKPGKVAIEAALVRHKAGGTSLDALEAGLAACELDPELMAIGLGSLPNADGELELDASVMDGTSLEVGAVCGVRGIVPVISVARRVMEKTPHNMLCGDQARRFAIEEGFKPRVLLTAEAIRQYEDWRAKGAKVMIQSAEEYIHSTDDLGDPAKSATHDTVTMLAVDGGRTTAACSTSGMAWKIPGRVGDSPIIGAGIYADDEAGCAGATGWGEELWKACSSFRAVEHMRQGQTAQEACESVIRHMHRRHPNRFRLPCVVFAATKEGDFGAACGGGPFDLWSCRDGVIATHHYEPLFSTEA